MPSKFRTRSTVLVILWMALGCWAPRTVRGDPVEFRSAIPAGALAYWAMDPAPFRREHAANGGERAMLLATLRAAVASGIAGSPQQARWVEGLLAAAMVGEVPHTLAVLEFRAHRDELAKKSEIDDLQIVLELRTPDRHGEYLRTVRAILIDAARAKGLNADGAGAQRRLTLPGDRNGVAYRAESWPAWREVSWCSDKDRFVIAMGKGALERWFAAEAPDAQGASWKRLGGVPHELAAWEAVEAFIDLDALRSRFPEGFDEGRIERMVAALELKDASALLVRASLVKAKAAPSLLAIDWITDVGGQPRALALTESAWPEGIDEGIFPVDGGTYVAIVKMDWRGAFDRAMRIHFATFKNAGAEREAEKHARWMKQNGAALDAVFDRLSPWLVLTDTPEPILPVPGLGSVFVAARDGEDAASLDARLVSLLDRFTKGVTRTDDGLWSLRVDDAGLVRIPAWAFIDGPRHAILAGGWGPPVVAHARKVIGSR